MEKICEFCSCLRAIVFCKPDSAFLCLSCDARVHSANAVSNRHLRCLLCDHCKEQPAHLRCLHHQMLLCPPCDLALHQTIAKHQKRAVAGFTGSPSANHFALLWGFDTNQLSLQEQAGGKDEQQSSLIMQQILDLNRLQLNETHNPSSAIRERRQAPSSSSSCITLGKIDECLEDSTDDLKADNFLPSPSSHSEYLSSYNALESNQFWPQNMEEPRVSEELDGFYDYKMPEVDMTFPNFEDLLRGDQDLSRVFSEDGSNAFVNTEKYPRILNNNAGFSMQIDQGNSTASSMLVDETNQKPRSIESITKMRPSYSYSYSFSHLCAESNGSDCQLQGPNIQSTLSGKGQFKDKNKSKLNAKQTQLSPRKRNKGRLARSEEEKKHGMKAASSY